VKRVSVLMAGLAALCGTPYLLMSFTGAPWEPVGAFIADELVMSPAERVLIAGSLVLWVLWLWTVLAFAVETVRFRRGATSESRISNRLMFIFIMTIWSSIVARPTDVSVQHSSASQDDGRHSRHTDGRWSLVPLALTTSVFAVAHVLRQIDDRRMRAIRVMPEGQRLKSVRGVEGIFWKSLLLAGRRSVGANQTLTRGWIPVGLRGDELVAVSVEPGHIIGVEARTSSEARAVVRHLQWMVESCDRDTRPCSVSIEVGLRAEQQMQVVQDNLGWQLVDSGTRFDAFGVDDNEARLVNRLYEMAVRTEPQVVTAVDAKWRVLVRVMGPVVIEKPDGRTIYFEKSRSIELLTWIVTHREHPTRTAARTAMWETNVQNATFNNVVSLLRTGLQRAMDDSGRIALDKTFDESMQLNDSIISDAELLESALRAFREQPGIQSRQQLHTSLELVRGMPFFGSDYLWPDPEGITSNIVHLIVTAAQELAQDALVRGDTHGVFRATGRGLAVLHCHEALVALRMRAYALNGDLAGVRHEWMCYDTASRSQFGEHAWEGAQLQLVRDELLGVAVVE